ncbi:hypothetical protein V9T40_009403 [Parthenolecanium corni]|uniref:SWIM-type domain-containing protein n=1 Tax=Parthenolecanium corni TaxID=536013 RepID=A0AAN9TQC8_9HEMI
MIYKYLAESVNPLTDFNIARFSMDVTYFKNSCDSESESDSFIEQSKHKHRRLTRVWVEQETYSSAKEAEEAVQLRKIWKISSSCNISAGRRVEYRCTAGKYRVAECAAGLYLLYHNTSQCVSLYETQNEHSNHVTDPTRGLSTDLKLFVQEKYAEGVTKPNAILKLLRHKGMDEPEKSKLITFLKTLRLDKLGSPTVSASEIRMWCEQRKLIPQNVDEPFVLDFHIHAESHDMNKQDLKIVISTPRLLSLATKSHMVQADATHKLTWQGYLFLLVGTSDANYVFHPLAVGITKGEEQDDFAFIFKALHAAVLEWKPSVLLADGSEAITNGFIAAFGAPQVRLMCYFHVIKNLEKYLRPLSQNGVSLQLKEDIYLLQTCPNKKTFMQATTLFLQKWREKTDQRILEFIDYFEQEWLIALPNWYEGAAIGIPSTNSGIEATNAAIKKEHILRERLPVGQFLSCTVDMVKQWSQRRDPASVNSVSFADISSISLPLWTEAYQWVAQKKTVLQRDAGTCTQYFTSSSKSQTAITTELLTKFERQEGKWKSFEEFKTWRTEIWRIEIHPGQVTCTCPFFMKKNQCKHSIGMLIRRKDVEVPLEAKSVPLDQKRKRGRPSKATRALLV